MRIWFLHLEGRLDLLGEDLLVEHIGDANADAGDLVLVARADAAPGSADLAVAEESLGHLVDRHVVRHQQVRVGRDQQTLGVDVAGLEAFDLAQQDARIDDDAVADHVVDAGGQDSGRDEVEGEGLAVRQDHCVSGVVSALVADHPLQLPTEQISRFPLAFVAPLGADQHNRSHSPRAPLSSGPPYWVGHGPQTPSPSIGVRPPLPW